MDIESLKARLAATPARRPTGRVLGVTGLALRFAMPGVRVGDVVEVKRRGEALACEVVGFSEGEAVAMPLGSLAGVGPDDEVVFPASEHHANWLPWRVRAKPVPMPIDPDGVPRWETLPSLLTKKTKLIAIGHAGFTVLNEHGAGSSS